MHKIVIVACYTISASFAFSSVLHIPKNLKNINKNGTFVKTVSEESLLIKQNKLEDLAKTDQQQLKKVSNDTETKIVNKTSKAENTNSKAQHNHHYTNKTLESLPILQKIHARMTRSKDAVWATITLTFLCVLLVLAVAQSRMWKDNYYKESQGVPLPNFNERVLFKDVMERKISTMKKFFKKKKSEENDVTELESLLPPSEWDN